MTPRQWQRVLAGLIVAAAVLLQFTVLSRLPIGAGPALVLATVMAVGMAMGPTGGAVAGFAAGLALDIVPPADGLVGAMALALTVAGALAGRIRDPRGLAPLQVAGIAAALALLTAAITIVAAVVLGAPAPGLVAALRESAVFIVVTAVLALGIVPGVGALLRRVTGARRRRRARPVVG